MTLFWPPTKRTWMPPKDEDATMRSWAPLTWCWFPDDETKTLRLQQTKDLNDCEPCAHCDTNTALNMCIARTYNINRSKCRIESRLIVRMIVLKNVWSVFKYILIYFSIALLIFVSFFLCWKIFDLILFVIFCCWVI